MVLAFFEDNGNIHVFLSNVVFFLLELENKRIEQVSSKRISMEL